VLELLERQFGISPSKLELRLKPGGGGRWYAYRECGLEVEEAHPGLYFGTLERDGFRLSVEGSHLVGRLATRGVVELTREQALRWMLGEDVEAEVEDGYVILRYAGYFLGCGRARGGVVKNFLSASRRLPGSETGKALP